MTAADCGSAKGVAPSSRSSHGTTGIIDQDRAGKALLVELDTKAGAKTVTVTEKQVGKTKFDKARIDAAAIASQPAFIEGVAKRGDPDLVLDVRIDGVRPDELDLHLDRGIAS